MDAATGSSRVSSRSATDVARLVRRALAAGAAVCAILAGGAPALAAGGATPGAEPARGVIALKSGALALYDEVLAGVAERLGAAPEERVLPDESEDTAAFVEEIRAASPALLLTLGSRASEFAQQHLEGTPTLYAMVLDPRDLRGPDIRGVPQTVPVALQLRELRALVPGLRTVGVPYNPANSAGAVREAEEAAAALGLHVEAIRVESRSEVVGRVGRYLDDVQALWLPLDSTLINRQVLPALASQARRSKIALMVHSAEIVRDGVLVALDLRTRDTGRALGELAARFLAGEPIARLATPEVRPRVVIDAAVARELGIPDERVRALEERYR